MPRLDRPSPRLCLLLALCAAPLAMAQEEPEETAAEVEANSPCEELEGETEWFPPISEMGLYSGGELLPENQLFAPEHQLWSDAATKRRWIYLPEGETIDVSDMDYWEFPVGTKLWKEFTTTVDVDGELLPVIVETRLLHKQEDGWFEMAYAWLDDHSDACAVPNGIAADEPPDWWAGEGTGWTVPSQDLCVQCHRNNSGPDMPLGFSAILLNHDLSGEEQVNLQTLIDDGRLSEDVDPDALVIPWREGHQAQDQSALGYLHVNCGSCHAEHGEVNYTAPFWLTAAGLGSVETTPTWDSIDASTFTYPSVAYIIDSLHPTESAVYDRMKARGGWPQMPPIGTELVDDEGLATILEWIESLDNPDAADVRKADGQEMIQRGRDLKRGR